MSEILPSKLEARFNDRTKLLQTCPHLAAVVLAATGYDVDV
jgi:hypothetical protein